MDAGTAELDPVILNAGLDLAMEFGPNWMRPMQSRLAPKYPRLSPEELDAYAAACRETMTRAHLRVPEHWNAAAGDEPRRFADSRCRFWAPVRGSRERT